MAPGKRTHFSSVGGQAIIEFALMVGSVIAIFAITAHAEYLFGQFHLAAMLVSQQAQIELQNSAAFGGKGLFSRFTFGSPNGAGGVSEFYDALNGDPKYNFPKPGKETQFGTESLPSPFTLMVNSRIQALPLTVYNTHFTQEAYADKNKANTKDYQDPRIWKKTWSFFVLRDEVNFASDKARPGNSAGSGKAEPASTTSLYYGTGSSGDVASIGAAGTYNTVLLKGDPGMSEKDDGTSKYTVAKDKKVEKDAEALSGEIEMAIQEAMKALSNNFGDVDKLIQSMGPEAGMGSLDTAKLGIEAKGIDNGVWAGKNFNQPVGASSSLGSGSSSSRSSSGSTSQTGGIPSRGYNAAVSSSPNSGNPTFYRYPSGFSSSSGGSSSSSATGRSTGYSGGTSSWGYRSAGDGSSYSSGGSSVSPIFVGVTSGLPASTRRNSRDGDGDVSSGWSGQNAKGGLSGEGGSLKGGGGGPRESVARMNFKGFKDAIIQTLGGEEKAGAGLAAAKNASGGLAVDRARWESTRAALNTAGEVLGRLSKQGGEKGREAVADTLKKVGKVSKDDGVSSGSPAKLFEEEDDNNKKKTLTAKKKKKKSKEEEEAEAAEKAILEAKLQREARALELLGGAVLKKEITGEVASARSELAAISEIVREKDPEVARKLKNLSKGLDGFDKNFAHVRGMTGAKNASAGARGISAGEVSEGEKMEVAMLAKFTSEAEGVQFELDRIIKANPDVERKLAELARRFKKSGSVSDVLALQTALEEVRRAQNGDTADAAGLVEGGEAVSEVKGWIGELEAAGSERVIYVADPQALKERLGARLRMARDYMGAHPHGDALTLLLKSYERKVEEFMGRVQILSITDAKARLNDIQRKLAVLDDPDSEEHKAEVKKMKTLRKDYDLSDPNSRLSRTVTEILEKRK